MHSNPHQPSMSLLKRVCYPDAHPKTELQPFVNSIVEEILMEDFPKTVVFVRTYNDRSNIYLLLQQKLGDMFTYPRGYPNLADYRKVEMFTRVLIVDKQTQVLSSFSDSETPLKVIVSIVISSSLFSF